MPDGFVREMRSKSRPESGVKGTLTFAPPLNSTRKNSSCVLAVLKNAVTASAAFSILLIMLPLLSKSRPIETGASSLSKCTMGCSTLSSVRWKFSRLRLVTEEPASVVT